MPRGCHHPGSPTITPVQDTVSPGVGVSAGKYSVGVGGDESLAMSHSTSDVLIFFGK